MGTTRYGEKITLEAWVTNGGEHTFEVTSVQAFFHVHFNSAYYAQNFSSLNFHIPLPPMTKVPIKYQIVPSLHLDSGPYVVTADLRYKRTSVMEIDDFEEDEYKVRVLSETRINLKSKWAIIDFEIMFILFVLGLLCFGCYRLFCPRKYRRRKTSTPPAVPNQKINNRKRKSRRKKKD